MLSACTLMRRPCTCQCAFVLSWPRAMRGSSNTPGKVRPPRAMSTSAVPPWALASTSSVAPSSPGVPEAASAPMDKALARSLRLQSAMAGASAVAASAGGALRQAAFRLSTWPWMARARKCWCAASPRGKAAARQARAAKSSLSARSWPPVFSSFRLKLPPGQTAPLASSNCRFSVRREMPLPAHCQCARPASERKTSGGRRGASTAETLASDTSSVASACRPSRTLAQARSAPRPSRSSTPRSPAWA